MKHFPSILFVYLHVMWPLTDIRDHQTHECVIKMTQILISNLRGTSRKYCGSKCFGWQKKKSGNLLLLRVQICPGTQNNDLLSNTCWYFIAENRLWEYHWHISNLRRGLTGHCVALFSLLIGSCLFYANCSVRYVCVWGCDFSVRYRTEHHPQQTVRINTGFYIILILIIGVLKY